MNHTDIFILYVNWAILSPWHTKICCNLFQGNQKSMSTLSKHQKISTANVVELLLQQYNLHPWPPRIPTFNRGSTEQEPIFQQDRLRKSSNTYGKLSVLSKWAILYYSLVGAPQNFLNSSILHKNRTPIPICKGSPPPTYLPSLVIFSSLLDSHLLSVDLLLQLHFTIETLCPTSVMSGPLVWLSFFHFHFHFLRVSHN